jgi:hypothetical protein
MSTSSSSPLRARVVQLYCPEHETTVDNFIITPSMEYADVLTHVKAAFRAYNLEDIRLCDVNGEPLYDNDDCSSCFKDVLDGERLLVAVVDERIRPEPELQVELVVPGGRQSCEAFASKYTYVAETIPAALSPFQYTHLNTPKLSHPYYQKTNIA